MFSIVSVDANANHCGGGHKEIKDTKDTSTDEDSKEAKTKFVQRLTPLLNSLND